MSQTRNEAGSKVRTIAGIRLIGGHAALDLVNTVDAWRDRWGPDLLTGYDDLVTWAERVDLIDADLGGRLRRQADAAPAEAEAALAQARMLRTSLRNLFLTEGTDEAIHADDVDRLNGALRQANQQRELRLTGGVAQWGWREGEGLDAILHRVAVAAADLFTRRGERRDVRECHGVNCGWLFLDTSRSGRRLWCSEESCGTHMRVRRFRGKAGSEA